MNDHVRLVTRLLAEAGYELDGSPRDQRLVLEATKLLDQARLDPVQAVAHVLSARMAAEKARASTKTVMESVEALQAMLEGLLDGQHLLCRLQGLSVGADNDARACVIVGGQLREVSVHPDVDPAELGTVLPWHYVCLHPTEMVVVGVRKDEHLFEHAKGQVVEFLGYVDDTGRFDRVVPMPEPTLETAEAVMAIYARGTQAWYLDDEIVGSLTEDEVRAAFIRPALAGVFDEPVLRYSTEGQSGVTVSAGRLLSNAHFEEGMVGAKRAAASRELRGVGVPAVTVEDVFDSLAREARSVARLMKMDRATLARELGIEGHVTRVELLPATGLDAHRYLRAS